MGEATKGCGFPLIKGSIMQIVRIISGGQTGSDQAGLDAAIETGLPYGGWCPKGRRSEEGQIPDKYVLKETGSSGYLVRTKLNVICSDATVVFTYGNPTSGSQRTIDFAKDIGRPCLHVDISSMDDQVAADVIYKWLSSNEKQFIILNVAGSRESSHSGIGNRVKTIIKNVIENKRENA